MARRNKASGISKNSLLFSRSFIPKIISVLLRFLIMVILIGFVGGIVRTLFDLGMLLHSGVEESLRQLLLNVITLLAVIEIIKTALNYLTEGRVKVTYIVDTVLIVMLNEVISLWFRGPNIATVIMLVVILFSLIVIRLLAIRFSPDND